MLNVGNNIIVNNALISGVTPILIIE